MRSSSLIRRALAQRGYEDGDLMGLQVGDAVIGYVAGGRFQIVRQVLAARADALVQADRAV